MPRRTNTDAIRDLEQAVATLTERIDHLRHDLDRQRSAHEETQQEFRQLLKSVGEAHKQIALFKQQVDEAKRNQERLDQKRWGLQLALVSAVVAGVVSLIVTLVSR